MKNYKIPMKYCPLSDIMGQDYDHTKAYKIYINEISLGLVNYMYDETNAPTANLRGMELKSFSIIDVNADTGDHVYLKGSGSVVDICIIEV